MHIHCLLYTSIAHQEDVISRRTQFELDKALDRAHILEGYKIVIDLSLIHIYIENLFIMYDINPDLVCDLACGTGNITIPLAKRGYDMTGVDISEDMLNIAREKAEGLDILFLNQSMTDLDLFGTMGAFLCMIDGINYVLPPKSLLTLFTKIKTCFIDPDGLFIFDISTEYKLKNVIGSNTFVHSEDVYKRQSIIGLSVFILLPPCQSKV